MRAHARRRAQAARVSVTVAAGDLRRFDVGRSFDLVLCVGDSAAHLHDRDSLVAHLRRVAAHLRPGGLYVVETAHPADFTDGATRTKRTWQVSRDGHRLRVRWGSPSDRFDAATQLEHSTVTLRVWAGEDRTPTVVRDRLVLRRWLPAEIQKAAQAAGGLRRAATYGGYDDEALASPSATRLITVLARRP
jgi:SAM-dependent methyltransferase